jgi:hypothetical protein
MSGGTYDYAFGTIDDLAGRIADKGSCSAAPSHLRQAFKTHLHKVAVACRAIERNDSGDGDDEEEQLIRACLTPAVCLDAAREAAEAARRALDDELR